MRSVPRTVFLSCLCVLIWSCCAAVLAQGQEKSAKPPAGQEAAKKEEPASNLPPGVLARLNGRDITVREYADYLLASLGKSHLDRYIDRLLIEAEARKQKIEVTEEEVERLVEERIDRTIKGIYRGDRERFIQTLERLHMTLEDRKAKERQEVYYDLLLERLVRKERKVTDENIRLEFERIYGPGGVQYDLRHILISTSRRLGPSGETLPARSEAEARELAEKIHKELLEGADFVQLVTRYSDDTFTRRNDGRIPLYRESFYGKEFHKAVEKLNEDNPVSGVVRSRRGFHLIQLVSKRQLKLEDVREEIEKQLREKSPSPREKNELIQRLRQEAKIER